MQICIDGHKVLIEQGLSIKEIVKLLPVKCEGPECKPLAAMMGGEIYNLNYVPKRDCAFRLVRYGDEEGRRVYERTLQFMLLMAVRKLFPDARVLVQYSIGEGIYIKVIKATALCVNDVQLIKDELVRIASLDLLFDRRRLNIDEATAFFKSDGQQDKAELLKWRRFSYFDVYICPDYSGYMDYFYGEMAPSTGYIKVFDLHLMNDALLMMLPSRENISVAAPPQVSPKLVFTFKQSDAWGRLMTCATVNELNRRVENGSVRDLIRVNEALHEKIFAKTAEEIIASRAKAVMLAGPSSSGKTTSANRITTQLRADGLDPIMLSLDDYYIDRDKVEREKDGSMDLEHINTLDINRFTSDLKLLLSGQEALVPRFSFLTGKREPKGRLLRLREDQPLIIEGIHALNPLLLGDIDRRAIFRIYTSALTTLNLDDHMRIRTTDLRILRRLVRDYAARGASMEQTLSMWASVRRGESRWVFPFQEQADRIINTTLVYEAAVMKRHVYPLLAAVSPESEYYFMARSIVKFLNYFLEADVENEIPPTSILREFIGGNTFYT